MDDADDDDVDDRRRRTFCTNKTCCHSVGAPANVAPAAASGAAGRMDGRQGRHPLAYLSNAAPPTSSGR